MQNAQKLYQDSIDRLTLNVDLPAETRAQMEEHFAYVHDQAMQGIEALYGVDLEWTPRQRPAEAA